MKAKETRRYYISTALPYINSQPHLGFSFEIIAADVIARFLRNAGNEVIFVTGTDENSFKVYRAAEKQGITAQELSEINSKAFLGLKDTLNVSFDVFYRTGCADHKRGAKKLWKNIPKKYIYKDFWSSKYCTHCETFYNKKGIITCPVHETELQLVSEENYFFDLQKFKAALKKAILSEKMKILPRSCVKSSVELLNGYKNFNISRYAEGGWGIEIPGDRKRVMYAFFEALIGYINAVGYEGSMRRFKKWWADPGVQVIQFCGKDIAKFHTIYLPSILLSLKIKIPSQIIIHGFVMKGGRKMSKSLGNVIIPQEVTSKYTCDAVRLYLMDNNIFTDFNFSETKLKKYQKRVSHIDTFLKKNLQHTKRFSKLNFHDRARITFKNGQYRLYEKHILNYRYAKAIKVLFDFASKFEKLVNKKGLETLDSKLLVENGIVLLSMIEPFMPNMLEGYAFN